MKRTEKVFSIPTAVPLKIQAALKYARIEWNGM